MLRATVLLRERGWEAKARRVARVLSPVAVSPAAPRGGGGGAGCVGAVVDASVGAGAGRDHGPGDPRRAGTSGVAERLTRMLVAADAPFPRGWRPGRWSGVPGRPWRRCRSGTAASYGRCPDQQGVRPLTGGALHSAGLLYRASRRLPSEGAPGSGDRGPSRRRWPRPWRPPMPSRPSGWG
jgi:hypothetical protein